MACEFCDRTFRGELVFEDEIGMVILHEDWSPRGHVMVVSRRHAQNASNFHPDEWNAIAAFYRRAEKAILAATGRERAVMLKLGIMVQHLHIHIYPANATHTRADVDAMIAGKAHEVRDAAFVEKVRELLRK